MERTINAPEAELLSPEDTAKWLGIPVTTFSGWVRRGQIPAPRASNKAVQWYSWDQVFAIRVLLGSGFLPLDLPPEPPQRKPEKASGGG